MLEANESEEFESLVHTAVRDTTLETGGQWPLQTSDPCVVHKDHSPRTHQNHRHHVWPKEWGGSDAAGNLITVCPTGHYSIHVLLSLYEYFDGLVPWSVREHFGPAERALAQQGWDAKQLNAAAGDVINDTY